MEPLSSQRYVYTPSTSYHLPAKAKDVPKDVTVYKPPSPPYTDDCVSSQTPQTEDPADTRPPFRLLDLPLEIQRQIFNHTYPPWSITLDSERLSMLRSVFHTSGVPSANLLRTCRHIYMEAAPLRRSAFTGRLTLNSVFILIPLRKKAEFAWLRANVSTLHFSDSSVRPERWARYYEGFEHLKRLEIDFGNLLRLDETCLVLDDVLGGRCDEQLCGNFERFRTGLYDVLVRGVDAVISLRYCLPNNLMEVGWRGVLNVKVLITHAEMRIIECLYDPDVEVEKTLADTLSSLDPSHFEHPANFMHLLQGLRRERAQWPR